LPIAGAEKYGRKHQETADDCVEELKLCAGKLFGIIVAVILSSVFTGIPGVSSI